MKQILTKFVCYSNLKHLRLLHNSKILGVRDTIPHFRKQYLSTQPVLREQITIRSGAPEDHNNVMRFLRQNYFEYEPIITYLGMTGSSLPSELLDLAYQQVKKGYTFVAENEQKRLVGIAVCDLITPEDISFLRTFMERSKNNAFRRYLEFTIDLMQKPNVWELYGVREYLEGLYLAVDPNYQCLGLGLKLIMEELLLAQRLNCLVYRGDVSNRNTVKPAEKLDLKCIHAFRYDEYLLNGEPIFKNVKESQLEYRVYIKKFLS